MKSPVYAVRDRTKAAVTAVVVTAVLAASGAVLTPWPFATVALAVVSGVVLAVRQGPLPWLLRPAVVLMAPVAVIGFVSASLAAEVQPAVGALSVVVSVGMVAGMLLGERGREWVVAPRPKLALVLLVVALLAAGYFFVASGVPLLGSDVEQGRVDAAASGTGYVRLLAYMSIPAALALVCTGRRAVWLVPACAVLVILGLANRSPILYVVTPCVLVLLNAGNGTALKIGRVRQAAFGGAIAAMVVAIVGLGAYRIVTQPEYRSFPEYSSDLESGNYVGVGFTAFSHYAQVVPSNGELVKSLVDDGDLPLQYGATYVSLFVTALPGAQETLDMKVRDASGKEFVGGGIPPTLGGEGYANFLWPGVLLGGVLMGWLMSRSSRIATARVASAPERRAGLVLYGYVMAWSVGANVAGFAGASTFPLAGFVAMCVLLRWRAAS